MMERLWREFDRIVVFDTETTGIEFGKDRIIELGAVSLENSVEIDSMDVLIRLPEGEALPPFITELTVRSTVHYHTFTASTASSMLHMYSTA